MGSSVREFEDLIVWQKARALTRDVYLVTGVAPFAGDFGLSRQLQRAAVSIMSNIAEGFERYGPNKFHQAIVIAKGSCAEVRSLLYVAYDCGYLSEQRFNELMIASKEVKRLLTALRASINQNRTTPSLPPKRPTPK